jgi:glyoxalase family protein
VTLSVPALGQIAPILTDALGFTQTQQLPALDNPSETVTIFAMEGGGPGKEVHVVEQPEAQAARLGRGGVHHVAYRLHDDAEQIEWNRRLTRAGIGTSGIIDRFYFKSLYFRITHGILFELATDGPGFATDESVDTLGERLALPPFLEQYRDQIEAGLKPL